QYLYYTPGPDLQRLGMLDEYRTTMDRLFDTYAALLDPLQTWLRNNFDEKDSILEKKAFDTLRGLLPMATLGQVAFRGNAQAFAYLMKSPRITSPISAGATLECAGSSVRQKHPLHLARKSTLSKRTRNRKQK